MDAQSSANGGIIIQVIGEMSNKGEPWRKFVQTFFLAEQPNGYFVLNDIFRFLKEEAVEDDPSEETDTDAPVQDKPVALESAPPIVPISAPTPPPEEPERAPTPTPAPAVTLAIAEAEPSLGSAEEEQVDGEPEPVIEPVAQESSATPSPVPASPAPVTQEPPAPSPAPAPQQLLAAPQPFAAPAAAVPVAPAPAAPTPSAAPVRKTWANLAATGSQKWGSAVAEAKGVSEVPVASSSPAPTSQPHTPAPRPPQNQNQPHPAYIAATSVITPQCFVKVCSVSLFI